MDKREDEPADKHENTHDDYKSELEQRQLQQHEGEEPAAGQPPAAAGQPPAVEQVTLVVTPTSVTWLPAGLGELQYAGYYCLWLVEDTHLAPGHFAPFVPVGAEFFLGDGCVAASATASPAHSSDVAPASDEDASGAE